MCYMIYRTTLLNHKDLDEQDKILKYFYLIDSEPIVKSLAEIVSSTSSDINNASNLFHTAFDQIFEASALYNQFTSPENITYSGFFGEPGCNTAEPIVTEHSKNLRSLSVFLKLALRNYCITEGFFSALTKNTDDSSYVRLSAPYDGFLNSGYYANPKFDKNNYKTLDSDSKSYQFYNSKWHSLRKLGKDSLLWYVLTDCSEGNDGVLEREHKKNDINLIQYPRFDFKVPIVFKFPIYTYFTENKIYQLSRKLKSNSKNILKLYSDIKSNLKEKENTLNIDTDKFIYRTLSEHYFGFSYISYINDLLTKIYSSQTGQQNHLIKYKGDILENILTNLSQCPLTYSRQFFLSYALEALRYNNDVSCNYLRNPPSTTVYRSPLETTITDNELTARGLVLITKYFNTLNNITLPLLSSLWQVVFYKLFQKKELKNNILLDYYRLYIDNYYSLLTADFTSLPINKINAYCSKLDYSLSLELLMKELNDNVTQGSKNLSNRTSPDILNDIIHNFLLYPKNHPCPLSDTLDLFSYASPGEDYDLQRNNFRYKRAKNTFDLFS